MATTGQPSFPLVRGPSGEPPTGLTEDGSAARLPHHLVPDRQQRAVGQLYRRGIAKVAAEAVVGDRQRLRPGAAVVLADSRLVAERLAAAYGRHPQPAPLQREP